MWSTGSDWSRGVARCSVGDPGGECLGQTGDVVADPADVTIRTDKGGTGGDFECRVGPDDQGAMRAVGQLGPELVGKQQDDRAARVQELSEPPRAGIGPPVPGASRRRTCVR